MSAIGFLDSGAGGLAVLARAARRLPEEHFVFLGDRLHAPYGSKSREEIQSLAAQAGDRLAEKGLKALVVACNTATSAAVELLRQRYPFPVIGMEPALKPALAGEEEGLILVMATPATLQLEKFRELLHRYEAYRERVVLLPCPELSLLIEDKGPDSPEVEQYLRGLFHFLPARQISGVVFGCTHYIFLRRAVDRVLGKVDIFDGVDGTVNRLAQQCGLRTEDRLVDWQGRVEFLSQGNPSDDACMRRFMELAWREETG